MEVNILIFFQHLEVNGKKYFKHYLINLGMNVYIRNNPNNNLGNETVETNCDPANLIGDFY